MHKWIALILGTLIVVGSVFGYVLFMKKYEQDVTTMTTIKPKEMINANTVITSDMIHEVAIPSAQHMKNAITDPRKIIGKRTAVPIGEAEEFVSWKLSADDIYPGEGEEYFGFPITSVDAADNMVRRGDKISVWATYNPPKLIDASGNQIAPNDPKAAELANSLNVKKIYIEKILDGVKVAHVLDGTGKEIKDAQMSTLSKLKNLTPEERDQYNFELYRASPSGQPANITFILNEEQINILAKASQGGGKIELGLKNPFMIIDMGNTKPKTEQTKASNSSQEQKTTSVTNSKTAPGKVGQKDGNEAPQTQAPSEASR